MGGTVNVFVMYAREDSAILLQFLRHFGSLEKDIRVSFWYDDPIDPKKEWSPQIISRFEDADVYLFMIGNTFMHSKFIEQLEFKMIIDRYKAGKSKVMPLILEDCPWDINFEADDYTFNFKELHVLPEPKKPIKAWDSIDQAIKTSAIYINNEIVPGSKKYEQVKPEMGEEKVIKNEAIENQVATSFSEEGIRAKEEVASQKAAAEQKRLADETEAKRKASEEEIRASEEAAQKAAMEQKRLADETQAKRKALDETIKAREEEAAQKRVTQEKRLKAEAHAKKVALEERNRLEEEAKAKRKTQEENSLREAKDVTPEAVLAKDEKTEENGNRRRVLLGVTSIAIGILGILWFSRNNNEPSDKLLPPSIEKSVVINDSNKDGKSISNEKPKSVPMKEAALVSKSNIGDIYHDGIVFEIDENSKTGKISHDEDFGPMTWIDATKIHEQLGDGWRLPTLVELKLMYNTIGQGATNIGEFADEFYWSATPFDENQARLVRFSDGNTSYHYNSRGTHRKFLVRAVRDIVNN